LDAVFGIVHGSGSRFGWSSGREELIRVVRLLFGDRRLGRPHRLGCRLGMGWRLRCASFGIVGVVAAVSVGRRDISADRLRVLARLALALRTLALLMPACLVAAWLMTTRLVATLPVTALALDVLAVLTGAIRARHVGIRDALRIRPTGVVQRGGKALTYILHVDVGDGEFTAAGARALPVVHGAQHTIIMVGMLEEILGGDPVACGARVARELEILFQDLVGIAANPQFLPAAVVALTLVVTAPHAMGFAWTPTASAAVVVSLLHVNVTSSSIVIREGSSSRMSSFGALVKITKRHMPLPLSAERSLCAEALFGAGFALRWPAFPRARPMVSPDCRRW
jgi:hypothetical protein